MLIRLSSPLTRDYQPSLHHRDCSSLPPSPTRLALITLLIRPYCCSVFAFAALISSAIVTLLLNATALSIFTPPLVCPPPSLLKAVSSHPGNCLIDEENRVPVSSFIANLSILPQTLYEKWPPISSIHTVRSIE